MRPWIWPGGQLVVQPCPAADLRVGDIAVWFDGHRLVSHRVAAKTATTIITRSDSSLADDPPAAHHQVLGRAIRFEKGCLSYAVTGPIPRAAGAALARLLPPAVAAVRLIRRPPR